MTKLAPPPDPTGVRRRRALLAASAAWAVLLVAAGLVSARRDEPTVREQRSVAQAAPVVDRAVGAVLAAARAEPVVLLSAPVVVPGCRLTPALPGAELSRQVTVHTRPADGLAAMRRIGAALPRPYAPAVRPRTGTAAADLDDVSLRADAGEFVTVRGKLAAPGVLRFTVDTGCRPAD
ncbi:MAG TPA: hypothetical protein VES42_00745, partial [Pilimelia sp.]|nr:hypothetical protein [Pilimelia sp.]